MFRPNRIGTPNVNDQTSLTSTATWTVNSSAFSTGTYLGNVINSVPGGELTRSAMVWVAAARTIPANERMHLVQQFTITQPIEGDIVGVELTGGMFLRASAVGLALRPVFGKLVAANGAAFAAVTFSNPPTGLLAGGQTGTVTTMPHYLTTAIHMEDKATVAGTYAHGFQIYNATASPITFDALDIVLAERQLNYQEAKGYRDTLR